MKHWIVLDWGEVPEEKHAVHEHECGHCGQESFLPVVGSVIAEVCNEETGHGSLIFDIGAQATPKEVMCPHCGSVYTWNSPEEQLKAVPGVR